MPASTKSSETSMAEATGNETAHADKRDTTVAADQSERAMMRAATIGLPVTTVVGAAIAGVVFSPGPAILVLTAGVLLGVIMLFWSSLRTLSGDAPLPADLLEAMATRRALVDDLADKKRMTLLALKDLERDHAVGKIDDKDYAELAATFRAQAKEILRDLDQAIDEERVRAETIAQTFLAKKGLAAPASAPSRAGASESESDDPEERAPSNRDDGKAAPAAARQACPKCGVSNEPDATFCKACGTAIKAKESLDAAG